MNFQIFENLKFLIFWKKIVIFNFSTFQKFFKISDFSKTEKIRIFKFFEKSEIYNFLKNLNFHISGIVGNRVPVRNLVTVYGDLAPDTVGDTVGIVF